MEPFPLAQQCRAQLALPISRVGRALTVCDTLGSSLHCVYLCSTMEEMVLRTSYADARLLRADSLCQATTSHRVCDPQPYCTSSAQGNPPLPSCCPVGACWGGTRRWPRPGLSVSPSKPSCVNRCTHL